MAAIRRFSSQLIRDKSYVSSAHPKSHINLIANAVPQDESDSEKNYRKLFEENQLWNHNYWQDNNTRFLKEKAEFIEKQRLQQGDDSIAFSQEDLIPFYKEFLDKNYNKHIEYNREWYRRQFKLLIPAFQAYLASKKRSLKRFFPSSR
ncbi:cytochrome c oxidase assembly factor 8-like [Panonychus citri]|uniref:cytochrome c oxidase assembly factor 8-like n=1 Tax=Panonychus citri TaxID=50023 RepID=UPI002307F250|nr:cytochrome c oxidase assembly factor 8-like [Panonychus citri]